MSFLQRRKTVLIDFVSFFNKLATERKTVLVALGSIPIFLFHFLMSLLHRGKLCSWILLDHGFQEENSLEGIHVKGKNSIMASKRSLLDGRKTLWKENMLMNSIRVGRSSSNILIEEITMSTTRSKLGQGRYSLSCMVERMGQVIT
jgi:hypothetical protein